MKKTKKKYLLFILAIIALALLLFVLMMRFSSSVKTEKNSFDAEPANGTADYTKTDTSKSGYGTGGYFAPAGNWPVKEDHGYVDPASNQVSHSAGQTGSESAAIDTGAESSESGSGNASTFYSADMDQQKHGSWSQ